MIEIEIKSIADVLEAKLIGDGNISVSEISIDSRNPVKNGLFFALKGENFDAHHYLKNAIEQGNVAVVVEQPSEANFPQLIVSDTRLALGKLAKWLKARINPRTLVITGSSGKTSVKEMTAAILQHLVQDKDEVLFTKGNFNNDIGVPLTLLRLTPKHKYAVVELGANHQGEIAYTTTLAEPDVALINNVASAHLEGFGSIEGVARAKGEIFRSLKHDGIALINLDCEYLKFWQQEIGLHQIQSFSLHSSKADFYAENIKITPERADFLLCTPQGKIQIQLPYLGEHNVANALAATALAMNAGATLIQVKAGLEQKSQVKGRLFPIQPCENLLLLDDTYNANPNSMQAAIAVLQKYQAFRIFVVGDMGELGENSQSCHVQVGETAKRANLDLVVSFGSQSAVISQICGSKHFENKQTLSDFVIDIIEEKLEQKRQVVLLAKASRSMQAEDVINTLRDYFIC